MNVFAVLSGVVLCFFVSCYFLRKKRGKYEFIKETDFEESASEYSQHSINKYGFHPVNVPMRPKVSDDDEDDDNENEVIAEQGNDEKQPLRQNPSNSDNDEYADASDDEIAANANV